MKTPLLSINIPVFNIDSNLIIRCLDSISHLDIESYEIILINDGSNLECESFLKKIEGKYANLIIIHQENIGLSSTRNVGIQNSSGTYLLFLDSDDWVNSVELSSVLKECLQNDLDIFGFGCQKINKTNDIIEVIDNSYFCENSIKSGLFFLENHEIIISSWAYLFKRTFILDNHLLFSETYGHEDLDHLLRAFVKAQKVLISKKIVYNYFLSSESITRTNDLEKIKRYLFESILASNLILNNMKNDSLALKVVKPYSNSVIWNLLYRFIINPKEVDYAFKIHCLNEMKKRSLYPIQGSLKTSFQKVSTWFFNRELVLKAIWKIRS